MQTLFQTIDNFCDVVDEGWTEELWRKNFQSSLGVSTWDEVLEEKDSYEVYSGNFIRCIRGEDLTRPQKSDEVEPVDDEDVPDTGGWLHAKSCSIA